MSDPISISDPAVSGHPLVTVVIPTYNRALLILEAIASVQAQTYDHWELIVADDGSEDGTVSLVRSLSDNRIRILELPHSGNIAAVRNAGVKAGSGAWIAFLDSDDLWLPKKLEIQLDRLGKQGKRWAYGGFELMNDAGLKIPCIAGTYTPYSGWITRELLTCEASVNIGTLLIDRTLFNTVGGFDTEPLLNYREDYDFELKLSLKAEGAALPELLMRVREHAGRVTHSADKGNELTAYVYEYFIKTHPGKDLERIARRQRAYHLTEAAVRSMKCGRHLRAIRQWGLALKGGDRWRHVLSAVIRCIRASGGNIR
jgi:glycosyltransferase involved in cell wall biosynthesis